MRHLKYRRVSLAATLAVILAASLTACGANSSSSGAGSPIKVVVAVPYSGAAGAYGQITDQAFSLALKNSGPTVDGHPIQLIKVDTQCTPSVAAQAINQALGQHPAAVFAACAGDTLAMKSLLAARKIPLVTASLTPSVMADQPKYVWDAQPRLAQVTDGLAGYMQAHKGSQVGIINDTTAYGAAVGDSMSQSIKSAGMTVATQATYDPSATDYSGQILRIRRANVNALFVEGYSESVARLISQARSLGITVPIYASPDVYDNTALKAGGASLNGVVFASPYVVNGSASSKNFQSSWQTNYQTIPTFTEEVLYEGVAVLVQALHQAGGRTDESAIGSALDALHMDLPSGNFTFNTDHLRASAPVFIGKVEDGAVVLISTVG